MKRVLLLVCCAVAGTFSLQAQYNYFDQPGTLKISGGYTHDFPGLNGYSVLGEYSHSLYDKLEGAFAVKRIELSGYPRSKTANEYTRATTLDFIIYYLPMESDQHILRVGLGYAFSFYKIRRSYPLVQGTGSDKTTTWQPQDKQGRISGFSLIGEYEYLFPESGFSIGLRAAFYKAYDRVSYVGPFVAMKL